MYQEKSSKLFLSCFPLQWLFAPLLPVGHSPLLWGREIIFTVELDAVVELRGCFFELAFVIRTAGDFSFEELFCLYT